MIRLTDEENPFVADRKYFNDKYGKGEGDSACNRDISVFNKGAKAQLKKVYGWGEEYCEEHKSLNGANSAIWQRRHCSKCWQALLEEIKL